MKVKGENDASGLYAAFFSAIAVVVAITVITVVRKKRMKKYYDV